jgi:formylglycine-generating enzyme required for sulfatase activity
MKVRTLFPCIAMSFAVFTISPLISVQADTFGTTGNEFTLDFVNIGNASNAADTTGYGAVPYEYRIGKYEIAREAIEKATASGLSNVTASAFTADRPASDMTWYEQAAFVNWLNTSTGKQAAYNLTWSGSAWSMSLWSSTDAWKLGGTNLYRHKNAHYFLPSENEWYKAAYYNPAGSNYFLYPTASSTVPTAVSGGTNAGTAVYNNNGIAVVSDAGGLSSYGTMAQGGNLWDRIETAFDGENSSPTEGRVIRGGGPADTEASLQSSFRGFSDPSGEISGIGFRVASVPEPSTYALLLMTGAGALWWARGRR